MHPPIAWQDIIASPSPAPHFGNPAEEQDAACARAIISPVDHFGLLRVSGKDAQSFLQGQLTCDLGQVSPTNAQYGGYCTPKGRLLASFVIVMEAQEYLIHLPGELCGPMADRLRKFILRSQVKIERVNDVHALGAAGPACTALLRSHVGEPPRLPLELVHYPPVTLLRLPGGAFLLFIAAPALPEYWRRLATAATLAGTDSWDWLQIRSGVAWITAATQEQFVPQMIGLDAIGGVSFRKGCYPGQEIVARAHYLGEVKRRLHRAHADGPARAGDTVLVGDQAHGTVVNAAPCGNGGSDLLVVAQTDPPFVEARLESMNGPKVIISKIDYAEAIA